MSCASSGRQQQRAAERGRVLLFEAAIFQSTERNGRLPKAVLRREQKKPTETVAPTLPSTANGVKPPPPHSKRQQRSALRLQEFQEKKRAAAVQDFVTQGADPVVAQEKVARLERKRLERIAADCVAPMEAEPSIEGRPPGEQERQPRGQVARPKRARGSGRPETG